MNDNVDFRPAGGRSTYPATPLAGGSPKRAGWLLYRAQQAGYRFRLTWLTCGVDFRTKSALWAAYAPDGELLAVNEGVGIVQMAAISHLLGIA